MSGAGALVLGAALVVPLAALSIERAISWSRRNGRETLAWRLVPVAVSALALGVMASAWWQPACRSPTAAGNRLVAGFCLLVAAAVLAIMFGSDGTLEATRAQLVTRIVAVPAFALLAAAFVAPNLLGAGERGAQKRTMSDMRTIGAALDRHRNLPPYEGPADGLARLAGWGSLPVRDGWDHPFEVRSAADGYTVTSRGCDCAPDASPRTGGTTGFGSDIVFSNGEFVTYPDGTQP